MTVVSLERLSTPADLEHLREDLRKRRDPAAKCVRVCIGPGCVAKGAMRLHELFTEAVRQTGADVAIEAKGVGCHGLCERGPLVIVHPGNIFYQRVEEPQEAYHRKPQPLIPFYDPFDRFPALWVMHDKYVLADIKHAGDAVGFEVTGNVEVLNLLGNWRVLSCEDIRIGERFRTFDGGGEVSGVFVALGDAKLVSEDRVMVTAAPYDGSES